MSKARLSVLSKDDIERIHESSLRILAEVGVKVESSQVVRLMKEAGARVDERKMLVYLDEDDVNEALRTAPRSVRICSRNGVEHTVPDDGVQLVSPDGQPPAVFDADTGRKRASTLKDLRDFAVLADALPEVDFIWPPVIATDMPPEKSSYYEFLTTIAITGKHVQHGAASADEAEFQIELAGAILGSRDELRRRPIFSDVCTPISPLRYDRGGAEALVRLARAGVPVVQLSMGIAGQVTPVTLAGTLVVVNAENLFGLAMTQVASPGAPSIYSSFSGPADLRTGVFLSGTPEGVLIDAAAVEMARYYGLPTCSGGPSTVARTLSAEAGYQSAISAMAAMLVGSDLVVGLGGLDRAGMLSMEKLVMDCALWRWLERLRAGIEVDEGTIGLDAVARQGPGGVFLGDPHTLRYMRKELMIPQITAHHIQGDLETLPDDLLAHSKARVKELLAAHRPPLLSPEEAERVGAVAKKHGIVLEDGRQVFEQG